MSIDITKLEQGISLAEMLIRAGIGVFRAFKAGDISKEEFLRYVNRGTTKSDAAAEAVLEENLDALRKDFRDDE